MTWAPPERPLNNIPRWNCAATGTRLGGRLRLSGGVPYLPHAALLDRSWNSRDVRGWVRAPLKQSHCTLLSLGALTAPHSTRSSVNAGLLARAPDRISFASIASISRSVLSTPAMYRDSGQREVLAHAKMRFSNCLTARSLASFDARQRTCDRRNRKRINRPCIALTSRSALARKNSSSSVL